jgi:hypothetical protein
VLLAAGFATVLLLAAAWELTRSGVWRMRLPARAAGAAAKGTAEVRPATRRIAAAGAAGLAAALLGLAAVGFNYWYAADGSHSPRASGDGTAERRVAIMPFAVQADNACCAREPLPEMAPSSPGLCSAGRARDRRAGPNPRFGGVLLERSRDAALSRVGLHSRR